MDESEVSDSPTLISEERSDSVYPLCFGVSFAFFALRLLSRPDLENENFAGIREKVLQGSARLLGQLVWRIHSDGSTGNEGELLCKLESARREVDELKQRRREDAKANEKVVSIFAMQEQSWLSERKKLRQHIGAVLNELRVQERKREEIISELGTKLHEKEILINSKNRELEEEEQKRKDLEEKLERAEKVADELRETAREHSSEMWKHKTAFIELVSSQRQLEAEMGRVHRQADAARQELDSVMEQKKESVLTVQKLCAEMMKMHKDLEQKDKILSAMLRKSKLDTAEKQMLVKEVKVSKAKRKQVELEMERWRAVSESRHTRHSLRSMLSGHSSSRSEVSIGSRGAHTNATGSSLGGKTHPSDVLEEYVEPKHRKEHIDFSPLSENYSSEGDQKLLITADVNRLEGWVRSEAEKYTSVVEQRHNMEVDAFVDQMRAKDEKLEAYRWKLMSMELESKRLQSHIEELSHDISQARQENMKLEALLSNREEELNSLKEQFAQPIEPLNWPRTNLNPSPLEAISKVNTVKQRPEELEPETKPAPVEAYGEAGKEKAVGSNQYKDIGLTSYSPEKQLNDEKVLSMEPVLINEESASVGQCSSRKNNSFWKMDLNALGVFYKIKRLKQLLMIERLSGKQESGEDGETECHGPFGEKGFLALMSLLNRHVSRYQSLQGKTDDICKRMHENNLDVGGGDSTVPRSKEEMKILQHFLEETLQLQRYMVATGQKLVELLPKITSGFVDEELNGSVSFDGKQFADTVRTLFREIQRGLEVRVARMIGDLEGTLACEGITPFRR